MRDRNREKGLKLTGKAIRSYGMISEGDRVLVAVSGGLDSLVMLNILAEKRRILPITFEIQPIHVEPVFPDYRTDRAAIVDMCKKHGLELEIRTVDLREDLANREGHESICHVCALKRRGELFKAARDLGCHSLAMGHHGDDAIETLLMNMVFNGTISSMPGTLSMFQGKLRLIRPLILMKRVDVKGYAKSAGLPTEKAPCPYELRNRREDMRKIIRDFEKMHPRARSSLMRSMSNIHREHLP
jgi:tRNA(Ile)-lysidine synthase TilS/MesJ